LAAPDISQECTEAIGQNTGIYETQHEGKRAFLLVMGDDTTITERIIQPSVPKAIENAYLTLNQILEKLKRLFLINLLKPLKNP
jgi:hypothetical protein